MDWKQPVPYKLHVVSGSVKEFDSSRMKMAWETNITLEASLSFGRMEGKASLILEKPES